MQESQNYQSLKLYFQDECRLGTHTRQGCILALKGSAPVCKFTHGFEAAYYFGAVCPQTGEHLFAHAQKSNTVSFQQFLNELSAKEPNSLIILVLDNAKNHKAEALIIPENIRFIFLPPYSPELNPIERVWLEVKRKLAWVVLYTLEEVETAFLNILQEYSLEDFQSLTAYPYIRKLFEVDNSNTS